MSFVGDELEHWLRKESSERIQRAAARRMYAGSGANLTDEDRKSAHRLAEQMTGRKLPKTTRAEDTKSAAIQFLIAARLDDEAAMLLRFADWVASIREGTEV